MIFKDPAADADDPEAGWQPADEYLSGNVRNKLRMAQLAAESHPEFKINVEALTKAQPKDLEASEIDIRLGATWLNPAIVQQFMMETFQPPYRIRYNNLIQVRYSPFTSEWRIGNKSAAGMYDIMSTETYGTHRANAYKILEDTLNLRDCRIYDTIEEDGKERRVLNQKETMLAQQKQQAIKDTFAGWVWQDPQRRNLLVKQYNELFNSTRPREYDGSHIHFVGMNRRSICGNISAMQLLMCFMVGTPCSPTRWVPAKVLRWQLRQWNLSVWACVRKACSWYPTI